MRLEKAKLVFRKDWLEIRRNWQVILPIVILPLMISVVLPVALIVISSMVPASETQISGFDTLIQNLPATVHEQLAGMTEIQVMIYIMALYFFAPFFLIIPLMTSSVIASDSFAGEKERKTIEALLATPISDSELLFGKMLVSFIPSRVIVSLEVDLSALTCVTWATFFAASITADVSFFKVISTAGLSLIRSLSSSGVPTITLLPLFIIITLLHNFSASSR